jgi:hypothetical protein
MAAAKLIDDIEALVAKLSLPCSASEAGDGWTSESKAAARDYFVRLRTALSERSKLPELGIVRGLDHWGVVGGDLLEEAASITSRLREVRAI